MLTMYRPFHRLDRDVDRFLASSLRPSHRRVFSPSVDVEEYEDRFLLRADLPGIKQEELSIEVSDGWLSLRGERTLEPQNEEHGMPIRERHFGSFARRFRLSKKVDLDTIQASYCDGVLTIELPKKPEISPRQISMQHH